MLDSALVIGWRQEWFSLTVGIWAGVTNWLKGSFSYASYKKNLYLNSTNRLFSPNGAELTLILMLGVSEALATKGVTWTWLDESKKT